MPEALQYNLGFRNNSKAFRTRTLKALEVDYVSPPFAQTVELTDTPQVASPDEGNGIYDPAYAYGALVDTYNFSHGSTTFTVTVTWERTCWMSLTVSRTAGSGTIAFKNQDSATAYRDFTGGGFNNVSGSFYANRNIAGSPGGSVQWPTSNLRRQVVGVYITDGTEAYVGEIENIYPIEVETSNVQSKNWVATKNAAGNFVFAFDNIPYTLVSGTTAMRMFVVAPDRPVGWASAASAELSTAMVVILEEKDSATSGKVDIKAFIGGTSTGSDRNIYAYNSSNVNQLAFGWDDGVDTMTVDEGLYRYTFHHNGGSWNALLLERTSSRGTNELSYELTLSADGSGTQSNAVTLPNGEYEIIIVYKYLNVGAGDWMMSKVAEFTIEDGEICSDYPSDRRNKSLYDFVED